MDEAIALLEEISGRRLRLVRGPAQTGDMQRTKADTRRIEAELGWHASTPLRDGLARQWEWASERLAARANP
jgi:nucleoside-diphosphate-sugar epimerase